MSVASKCQLTVDWGNRKRKKTYSQDASAYVNEDKAQWVVKHKFKHDDRGEETVTGSLEITEEAVTVSIRCNALCTCASFSW